MKIFKNVAIYLLIVLLAILLIKWSTPPAEIDKSLTYNEFKQAVAAGNVSEVSVVVDDPVNTYTITMKNGKVYELTGPTGDQALLDALDEQKVTLKFDPPPSAPWWVSILPTFIDRKSVV